MCIDETEFQQAFESRSTITFSDITKISSPWRTVLKKTFITVLHRILHTIKYFLQRRWNIFGHSSAFDEN